MGSKGGGGVDTSGLEEATKEATALQKMIYEQSREDVQPWYQAGVGGIGKLSDLLGISGGSVQDRQGIYDELMPQYTTQTAQGGGNQYTDPNTGQVITIGDAGAFTQNLMSGLSESDDTPEMYARRGLSPDQILEEQGYTSYAGQPTSDTDYGALNAAVDERLGSQTTPEGYGSLLDSFTMEDFEADAGYQYRQDEAQKALERQMSAQGITLGGGGYGTINPQVAKALEAQSQGMASQEYASAFDRKNIEDTNTFNRLMGVAGMGQGSTAQMQQGGQSYATNVGNLQTGLASAQQQAQLAADSQPSMFGSLLGAVAPIALGAFTGGAGLGLGATGGAAAGGAMSPDAWTSFLARN